MVSYYCCYSYWKLSESQTEFLFEMRPGEFYLWLALSDCCKFCLVERPMVLARKLWFNRWSGFTIFALSRYANWHKSQHKELHLINYEWMHEWKRYIYATYYQRTHGSILQFQAKFHDALQLLRRDDHERTFSICLACLRIVSGRWCLLKRHYRLRS